MIFLGIDPGETLIGIGVIKKEDNSLSFIDYKALRTKKGLNQQEKLNYVYKKTISLLEKYNPDYVGIESLFFYNNLKTAIKVSQTRGVILLACSHKNKKIIEFTPLQVKQSISGYGRADKKQIQLMVKAILNLKEIPKPDDCADALALAICTANSYKNPRINKD